MSTDNPWATPAESTPSSVPSTAPPTGATGDAPAANPWGDGESVSSPAPANTDWLTTTSAPADPATFDWLHPFQETLIPLNVWVDQGLDWLVDNFRPVFQAIRWPIDAILTSVESTLLAAPALLIILIFVLLAWQMVGRRLAVGTLISLVIVGLIGAWSEAMVTLALVLTSVFFCILVGLPLGIWLARNDRALAIFRPILDAMQTTPAFVYLVPIVMLFGIGNVPGVVVTIIFALPPLIRLTNLGIRQVPADLVEAAQAFGASPRQLLYKVQIPLAMPNIMAGVNQTLMLALSMVVIASMIAVGGLGQMVLRGIGRLDMGLATVGGVGIVLLAIILDRLTQSFGADTRHREVRHWYQQGPAGLVYRLLGRH
ncbi:MAG: glycine betaine/L-proline ABC transporter permease ProW [Candidatus Competibacteraceae bacterium]|nr:MAG: glycine betaine/L-proline ABC transporter permease ProW [Candidatus Competibacteraceae bacterium]